MAAGPAAKTQGRVQFRSCESLPVRHHVDRLGGTVLGARSARRPGLQDDAVLPEEHGASHGGALLHVNFQWREGTGGTRGRTGGALILAVSPGVVKHRNQNSRRSPGIQGRPYYSRGAGRGARHAGDAFFQEISMASRPRGGYRERVRSLRPNPPREDSVLRCIHYGSCSPEGDPKHPSSDGTFPPGRSSQADCTFGTLVQTSQAEHAPLGIHPVSGSGKTSHRTGHLASPASGTFFTADSDRQGSIPREQSQEGTHRTERIAERAPPVEGPDREGEKNREARPEKFRQDGHLPPYAGKIERSMGFHERGKNSGGKPGKGVNHLGDAPAHGAEGIQAKENGGKSCGGSGKSGSGDPLPKGSRKSVAWSRAAAGPPDKFLHRA